ncbi:inactive beta-amylase 9 [Impatiens glandulifera]|uniref:inactive beta-amylase 9 n=1 Tax=Impatiens glandulifera TaxID=253017 RepID=UPI001FB06FCF|nr:inactive beta-amylase 9 [Impatiens glandulifera]
MEVSALISSQSSAGFFSNHHVNPNLFSLKTTISFTPSFRWPIRSSTSLTLRAYSRSESLPSHRIIADSSTRSSHVNGKTELYVGLPIDAISECNAVNHERAIVVGLKALKLLGVDGVEVSVWWGVVEKNSIGEYDWSGYLALANMVDEIGLKLRISICFHASDKPRIDLPDWVSRIGELQPDIFFTDRAGDRYRNCLSLAVDQSPVLHGKTPVQVYKDFCESFKCSFNHLLGSTITGISIGLGPNGELCYPSQRKLSNNVGVGEFQCYDKNMLNNLKQHAEASGNPFWGLSGPHDAPSYDQSPNSGNFFNDDNGSWNAPYGQFFLSWYSSQLMAHGDRILSLAASTFKDSNVEVYGKIPLLPSWYKTQSRPSELTAGFYNIVNRDGYDEIARIFAQNSCKMILPGMDLSNEALSSPELLTAQIMEACERHGVELSGENSLVSGAAPSGRLERIEENMAKKGLMSSFTYQRMGAYFFSPDHFPSFTQFVRRVNQTALHSDDAPSKKLVGGRNLVRSDSGKDLEMQGSLI